MAASHGHVRRCARRALQLLFSVSRRNVAGGSSAQLVAAAESTKIRYKGAHFVPLSVIESLLSDKAIDEDRWAVDGESECLVAANQGRGPFRVALRSSAGVDRLQNAAVEVHSTACLEFARGCGLWTIVSVCR